MSSHRIQSLPIPSHPISSYSIPPDITQYNTKCHQGAGGEVPEFAHVGKGIKTLKLKTPVRFEEGQFLGLTSKSTSLNICSISGSNIKAEEKGELETTDIWYGEGEGR